MKKILFAVLLVSSQSLALADSAFKFVRCNWSEDVDGAHIDNQLSLNILSDGIIARRIEGTHSRQVTTSGGDYLHSFSQLSGRYVSTDSGMGHQFVTIGRGRVVDNAEGDVHLRGALQMLSLEMVNENGSRAFSYRLHNNMSGEQEFVSASNCMFNNTKLLK